MFCFIIKMPLFIFVFSQSSNILDLKEYKWHVYSTISMILLLSDVKSMTFQQQQLIKKKITKNLVFKT